MLCQNNYAPSDDSSVRSRVVWVNFDPLCGQQQQRQKIIKKRKSPKTESKSKRRGRKGGGGGEWPFYINIPTHENILFFRSFAWYFCVLWVCVLCVLCVHLCVCVIRVCLCVYVLQLAQRSEAVVGSKNGKPKHHQCYQMPSRLAGWVVEKERKAEREEEGGAARACCTYTY